MYLEGIAVHSILKSMPAVLAAGVGAGAGALVEMAVGAPSLVIFFGVILAAIAFKLTEALVGMIERKFGKPEGSTDKQLARVLRWLGVTEFGGTLSDLLAQGKTERNEIRKALVSLTEQVDRLAAIVAAIPNICPASADEAQLRKLLDNLERKKRRMVNQGGLD